MSDLNHAISVATRAHAGQLDKAGQPYILHPLRVMFRFNDEIEMTVAVMHDVLEDSEFTSSDLKKSGFSIEVIEAVKCLTRRIDEDYERFISRLYKNNLARKIKIEDLRDNLNLARLESIAENDVLRINDYHKALKILTS